MRDDNAHYTSRRRFLQSAATLVGASAVGGAGNLLEGARSLFQDPPACPPMPTGGTPFVPGIDKRPIVLRKSINAFTPAELTRLRSAFTALRALPSTDNRRWVIQADLHALYCDSCNNTSTDIHGTWNFFPWHRAYLYYYERILGSLVGDIDHFRLPYWDWENIRTLPSQYTAPGSASNSLWDGNREPGLVGGGNLPSTHGTQTQINSLNLLNDFATFGGNSFANGAVEASPHGTIHVDVGRQNPPWLDMGNLGYAARDPLFFAHHCNLDKLWSRWNALSTGAGLPAGAYQNPADAGFLNARWSFYDENQQTVSISAADVLNHAGNLRYIYDRFRFPIFRPIFIYKCRLICCVPGPDPAPFIQIDVRAREEILRVSRLQSPVLLVLRGVPIPANITGSFDVLAVRGEQRVPVGSFGVIAHAGRRAAMERKPLTLVLDITRAVDGILARENPAGLHVVRSSNGQPLAKGFALRASEAEIRAERR